MVKSLTQFVQIEQHGEGQSAQLLMYIPFIKLTSFPAQVIGFPQGQHGSGIEEHLPDHRSPPSGDPGWWEPRY